MGKTIENQLIVRIDDVSGKFRVYLPNGEPLYGEISVSVKSEVGEMTITVIKCIAKIKNNG